MGEGETVIGVRNIRREGEKEQRVIGMKQRGGGVR